MVGNLSGKIVMFLCSSGSITRLPPANKFLVHFGGPLEGKKRISPAPRVRLFGFHSIGSAMKRTRCADSADYYVVD